MIDCSDLRLLRFATVTPLEMGPIHSAVMTSRAIMSWHPSIVIMTGICAGNHENTNKGDLVIANQVYDHVSSTIRAGKSIPFQHSISQEYWVLQVIKALCEDSERVAEIGGAAKRPDHEVSRFKIHVGSVASGSLLVKDEQYMQALSDQISKLYALDMEAFAVATATKLCTTAFSQINWLIAKGVVDFGSSQKDDEWHSYCSFMSAKFAKSLLEYALVEDVAYRWILSKRETKAANKIV